MISTSGSGKCNPTRKKVIIAPGESLVADSIPAGYTDSVEYSVTYKNTTTNEIKKSNYSVIIDDTSACEMEYVCQGKLLVTTSAQVNSSMFELLIENREPNPICVFLTRTL